MYICMYVCQPVSKGKLYKLGKVADNKIKEFLSMDECVFSNVLNKINSPALVQSSGQ